MPVKINLRPSSELFAENPQAIELNKDSLWKYKIGDSSQWSSPNYNDRNWNYTSSLLIEGSKDINALKKDIIWFRLSLEVDPGSRNQVIALQLVQGGASQIFFDGKLLYTIGKIDKAGLQKNFNPKSAPLAIYLDTSRYHVLAIRYSNPEMYTARGSNRTSGYGFSSEFSNLTQGYFSKIVSNGIMSTIFTFYTSILFALGLIHFLLFIFYRVNKSNLYYSIFAFSFGVLFVCLIIEEQFFDSKTAQSANYAISLTSFFYQSALLLMLYNIFYNKIKKIFWIWFAIFLADFILSLVGFKITPLSYMAFFGFAIEALRLIIVAIFQKKQGAWIIGTGVIVTVLFFSLFVVLSVIKSDMTVSTTNNTTTAIFGFLAIYATLSIPISMTIYLAREFARTNTNLTGKLKEVEELSAKTIEQEKEKQNILENQNITLERQVKERTSEITAQKKVIEEKNKDITDSINYALRIQESTLPPKELKYKLFPDAFVLFKPKDIVSGDFYWFYEVDDLKYIAAADCTGHGVPGALVSIVCTNALNRSLKEFGLRRPDEILNNTRELVLETFEKSSREVKDGMDISLVCLSRNPNTESQTIQWAGANNPIWFIRNGEFGEIEANKQPIGKTEKPAPFTNHVLTLKKGDRFYLFSDGYADQFGGPKGKKLKYQQLKDLILAMQNKTMPEQEKFLDQKFEEWKNWPGPDGTPKKINQIDDVLVIGVTI